jgi:hypothetical protein
MASDFGNKPREILMTFRRFDKLFLRFIQETATAMFAETVENLQRLTWLMHESRSYVLLF